MSAGTSLRQMREQEPLIHQIANYVVMNETADVTLALGALRVMAHAIEEVEEMVGTASALVLNIGALSARWIEALLVAGLAANKHGVPVVLDSVGAGATRFRTENAKQTLDEVDIAVLRANPGKVATLVDVTTHMRGIESIGAGESAARDAKGLARSTSSFMTHSPRSHLTPTASTSASATLVRRSPDSEA